MPAELSGMSFQIRTAMWSGFLLGLCERVEERRRTLAMVKRDINNTIEWLRYQCRLMGWIDRYAPAPKKRPASVKEQSEPAVLSI